MTPRQRRIRNEYIRKWAIGLLVGGIVLVAIAEALDLTRPITGHELANEYSRTDFYPPEEQ